MLWHCDTARFNSELGLPRSTILYTAYLLIESKYGLIVPCLQIQYAQVKSILQGLIFLLLILFRILVCIVHVLYEKFRCLTYVFTIHKAEKSDLYLVC